MATHSSFLAWRIPWTEEPGGLQSMGSQRVGHDWVTNTNTNTNTKVLIYVYVCVCVCVFFSLIGFDHFVLLFFEFSLMIIVFPSLINNIPLILNMFSTKFMSFPDFIKFYYYHVYLSYHIALINLLFTTDYIWRIYKRVCIGQ